MTRRIDIPADHALTEELRPLADAVVVARMATEDAQAAVTNLAAKANDTQALAADNEAVRAALTAGKEPGAKAVTSKATDELAAARRVAAARLDLATEAEAEATTRFSAALYASTDALIDIAQARADAAGAAYREVIAALVKARAAYIGTVTDLGNAWSRHLDVEHSRTTGQSRSSRRWDQHDPGPRAGNDMSHPRMPYELPAAVLADMFEHDATRHVFHDPRTGVEPLHEESDGSVPLAQRGSSEAD